MTRRVGCPLAVLLFACWVPLPTAVAEEPPATEETTIRSLEEQERTAVLKEDVPALERLWSEQLIVNTPQNEVSADRGVVLDRVRRGLIRYSQFDRQIEVIRFSGDPLRRPRKIARSALMASISIGLLTPILMAS